MKVIPKTESLDALHFSPANGIDEVIAFAHNNGEEITASVLMDDNNTRLTISANGQVIVANRGDWMVRRPDGKIDVMSDEQFNATFQRSFA